MFEWLGTEMQCRWNINFMDANEFKFKNQPFPCTIVEIFSIYYIHILYLQST